MPDAATHIATSPVKHAIEVLGDRWSLLILRDTFQGAHRFEEFIERTGATRATLTNRLRALVEADVLVRVCYRKTPLRYEYRLTRRGRDLFPVALAAWRWERRWAVTKGGVPARLRHARCGHPSRPELVCAACGKPLSLADTLLQSRRPTRPPPASRATPRRLSASTASTHRGSRPDITHITDIVGDHWMPLIVSAAFFGQRRFEDIAASLGIASNILAQRLGNLVELGVLRRRSYSRNPARSEYCLTEKGRDLFPYAAALNAWSERWLGGRAAATAVLRHATCGQRLQPVARCDRCGDSISIDDVTFEHPSTRRRTQEAANANDSR